MEKLIPLLNERHNLEWVLWSNANWDYLFVKWDKEDKFYEEQIISKKFWFIKWLVENEKIDYWTRNPLCITERLGEKEKQIPYSFYEEMLIRLAISDKPIEDLISYLK